MRAIPLLDKELQNADLFVHCSRTISVIVSRRNPREVRMNQGKYILCRLGIENALVFTIATDDREKAKKLVQKKGWIALQQVDLTSDAEPVS